MRVPLKHKYCPRTEEEKNTVHLCLYNLFIITTELDMLIIINLSSIKEKVKVLFSSLFLYFVPLVRVTSVQGLFCILPAFPLSDLFQNCPFLPLAFRIGHVSSCLIALPLIYFYCRTSGLLLGLHLVLMIYTIARATPSPEESFRISPSEIYLFVELSASPSCPINPL